MNLDTIFIRLWNDYITQNPSAGKIHSLFLKEVESVVNDHIAFRTLDYPEINIDVLAQAFISNGYVAKGEYVFKDMPGCYYEFAQRYTDSNGQLYNGFIAKSADKIFESTNFYRKK